MMACFFRTLSLFLLFLSLPQKILQQDSILSEFRILERGKTERIDFPKNEILNPIMIACTDKAIALSNIFKPTYLSLYDYRNRSFAGHFLHAGRGADEVSLMTTFKSESDGFHFWDPNKHLLSSVKADTPWLISKSVSFAKANDQIFKVYRLNDDMSLGTGPFKGRPFAILDNTADSITTLFGSYPLPEDNLNDSQKAYACQWNCHYNPDLKRMAAATTCGSFIAFYDLKDMDEPVLIRRKGNILPKFEKSKGGTVKFLPDNIYGFIDVAGNYHYCVALYWGQTYNDFPTGLFGGNILLIYDWEGQPIKAIRLKHVYRAITIMPDSDIIFLVGKNGEYWRIDSLNLKIKMPEPILENRVLERHDTRPSVQNVLLGQGLE